jgi:hypothetical protein
MQPVSCPESLKNQLGFLVSVILGGDSLTMPKTIPKDTVWESLLRCRSPARRVQHSYLKPLTFTSNSKDPPTKCVDLLTSFIRSIIVRYWLFPWDLIVKEIIKVNIIDYFLINKRKTSRNWTTLGNKKIISIF